MGNNRVAGRRRGLFAGVIEMLQKRITFAPIMVFRRIIKKQRICVVSICTSFLSVNHQVKVISTLRNSKTLPFSEVLTKEDLSCHMKTLKYRVRTFSPEVTLWAFLSQAIEDDKSQQAAVSRIVAAAIAQGEKPPSANTSAYSQARSRLSEERLAALTRETAQQIESSTPNALGIYVFI